MNDITLVLQAASRGERQAAEDLFPLVYAELRRMAAVRMVDEAAGQTLQPTALVHEAWLQMVGAGNRTWQNRGHFFGTAAAAMRHILIDHARRKAALKHGGGQCRVPLENLDITTATPDEHLLLVEEALQWLEREDPEKARIVSLKFFGGLTNGEVAECLGIGLRTVVRQWVYAKVKLFRWIQNQS
jgi:RNA polymerase sigma factor (TIGR02999 family)